MSDRCTKCDRTAGHCRRLAEHYPYKGCCKVCDHPASNERANK